MFTRRLFTKVARAASRSAAARNHGLQAVVFLFLGRWNKADIPPIGHDQHHLTRITPLVRTDQNILESAFLHRENDLLDSRRERIRTCAFCHQAAKRLPLTSSVARCGRPAPAIG